LVIGVGVGVGLAPVAPGVEAVWVDGITDEAGVEAGAVAAVLVPDVPQAAAMSANETAVARADINHRR